MASVVFMRAVNVGGHQIFRPSRLVKDLARLGAVNIGAAGTIVIRAVVSEKALREEFRRRLAFPAELMVCRGRDVLALAASDPFAPAPADPAVRWLVSILAKRPRALPTLPLPVGRPGRPWEVQILGVSGRFALLLWRRLLGKSFLDPNTVLEKALGGRATTRNWNTMLKVRDVLQSGK